MVNGKVGRYLIPGWIEKSWFRNLRLVLSTLREIWSLFSGGGGHGPLKERAIDDG